MIVELVLIWIFSVCFALFLAIAICRMAQDWED